MVLFVGDKPSKRMKPGAKPFEGAACEQRLKEWIEYLINPRVFGSLEYKVINQCDYAYANFVAMSIRDKHILIALGNNSSKALETLPHFKLPHPSGRNRQINNKK